LYRTKTNKLEEISRDSWFLATEVRINNNF